MTPKETALIEIAKLVERFEEQFDSYKADYNETLTRRDFIDPFFKALGWDMDNQSGYSEAYRDVIHEDRLKMGGATKAPDYCFRIGGKKLFYVEAKRPSVFIKDNITPAYQIRRYGYTAKLPICIITDFEELAIYDCTKKPSVTNKASVSRIKYFTYKEYIKEFDFIWDTFSKEKVLKGGFDKFVLSDTFKRGTSSFDKDFLESLDKWRKALAVNIALNNKRLNEDELNFVVQQIIDRVIFLRIAEDRRVEPYENLKYAIESGNYYNNLFKIFKEADEKYNSGLFDFKKDIISPDIKIDNKVLKNIIIELYYPESPYEFSVLDVEILGNIYEQFLGKQIIVSSSNKVKIELKLEVRKAGGVYYTPQNIVEYIVKQTVGKKVLGKSPKDISKIKILDPACGSGSFLLGAYSYLLTYHENYYLSLNLPIKTNKEALLTPEGKLTVAEKKRILLNNIYGVDIDINAVEVTKLSLLLKCMEGETETTIQQQMNLWNERILPTLDENIKSGNSLIDTDFYSEKIDFGEEKKIRPFNWKNEFKEIFKEGGFDVILGNPPYVFTRDVDWPDEIKKYYWEKFELSKADSSRKNQSGKINLYILFILTATKLINGSGLISFIIPNGLLRTTTYDTTRKFLLEKTSLVEIVDLKEGVFEGVTASTIIINYNNKTTKDNLIRVVDANYKLDKGINETKVTTISQASFLKNVSYTFSIYVNENELNIFNKLNESGVYFKDIIVDIIEGIVAHKEYISDKILNSKYKPLLEGKDISRYQVNFSSKYILFDRKKLHRARPDYVWEADKKIIIRRISGGSSPLFAAIDKNKYYSFASTNLLLINDVNLKKYSYEMVCALLNSKLLNFYYSKNFSNSSNLTVNISKTFLEMLPLPVNFSDSVKLEIEENVELIMKFYSQLNSERLQTNINQLKSKIIYINNKIDTLVYKLYDLTSEEIKIVEGE